MIEKLSCVSCGGRLEVPERTRYLNCNHCDQSLAVKYSETATFTEAMEQLTEVAEDVAALKINQEIYELDRSWESEQDNFKVSTCLLYTSPSPRDPKTSRMPSSA